jgi:hypothetical protein
MFFSFFFSLSCFLMRLERKSLCLFWLRVDVLTPYGERISSFFRFSGFASSAWSFDLFCTPHHVLFSLAPGLHLAVNRPLTHLSFMSSCIFKFELN